MDFRLSERHQAFQKEAADFADTLPERDDEEFYDIVRMEMVKRRWLAMAWPEEYGGLGATPMEQMVFKEVMG